jgi:hypothetical protein
MRSPSPATSRRCPHPSFLPPVGAVAADIAAIWPPLMPPPPPTPFAATSPHRPPEPRIMIRLPLLRPPPMPTPPLILYAAISRHQPPEPRLLNRTPLPWQCRPHRPWFLRLPNVQGKQLSGDVRWSF